MRDKLAKSGQIMRQISRKLIANKIILALVAIVIVVIIIAVIYFKWFF
jgi:hypothetical protein